MKLNIEINVNVNEIWALWLDSTDLPIEVVVLKVRSDGAILTDKGWLDYSYFIMEKSCRVGKREHVLWFFWRKIYE